jgi:hypothetical protein
MCLHGTLPQEVRSTRREEESHLFGTVLVLVVAVAVGVLVFRLTDGGPEGSGASEAPASDAWTDRPATRATQAEEPAAEVVSAPPMPLEPPEGYIRVAPGAPSWHTRLGGAMGLVIAVAVGAVALALSLWALGTFVARMLTGAAESAPPV